jgi:16S rRNA processing protein RimM
MEKIYVAKLGKTVGLKGQQKLHIDSDFPEQFKKNAKFITDKNQELTVESYNDSNNVIKFIGVDSIEDAKKLTNRQLFTSIEDTKELCKLEEKEFFWFDMMDCLIIENEIVLGKVIDIQRMPLSDYLLIETTKELIEKKLSNQFLIPYIDDYILNVDINNKKILTKNSYLILENS